MADQGSFFRDLVSPSCLKRKKNHQFFFHVRAVIRRHSIGDQGALCNTLYFEIEESEI